MSDKYESIQVNGTFYRKQGWFFMYTPFMVPYGKVALAAQSQGYKLKNVPEKAEIIEKSVSFGRGWVAVEIHDPGKINDPSVFKVNGEFYSFLLEGPYKQLRQVYQQVMSDFPSAKEYYNIYLNSPDDTQEENLKTMIVWR